MHTGMLFVPNLSPGHIFGTDFGTSGDRNGVTFVPGTCPQKMSPGTNSGQKNSPGDDFGTDFVTRVVIFHLSVCYFRGIFEDKFYANFQASKTWTETPFLRSAQKF
jgi:hypothetical protein